MDLQAQMEAYRRRKIMKYLAAIVVFSLIWILYSFVERQHQAAMCMSLWSCAENGENECVRQNLEAGADPNCQNGEPMRRAKQFGHRDTVAILRRAGARE